MGENREKIMQGYAISFKHILKTCFKMISQNCVCVCEREREREREREKERERERSKFAFVIHDHC